MALIEQWRKSHPWFVDSIGAMAGAVLGLGAISPFFVPAAQGTLIAPRERDWEHPLRRSILNTLERSPGIHFRELQRSLEAANGTLRHHLNILSREGSVTVVPVNGRTCYYAGAPARIEILEGTGVEDERRAAACRAFVQKHRSMPSPYSEDKAVQNMYWYLVKQAPELMVTLSEEVEAMAAKTLSSKVSAFVEEHHRAPREDSQLTPERRLGLKHRRESPEEEKYALSQTEELQRFQDLFDRLIAFVQKHERNPRYHGSEEGERQLYGEYQKAKSGETFPDLSTAERSLLDTRLKDSLSLETQQRIQCGAFL